VLGQPGFDVRVLVGAVVVEDQQVHGEVLGHLFVDAAQEPEELSVAVPGQTLTDDPARRMGSRARCIACLVCQQARKLMWWEDRGDRPRTQRWWKVTKVVQLLPERDVLAAQDGCAVRRVPSCDGQFDGQGYGARGGGLLLTSQAMWRSWSWPPGARAIRVLRPPDPDTFAASLSAAPGGGSSGRRASWWCRDVAGGAASGTPAAGPAETAAGGVSRGEGGGGDGQPTCSRR